MLYLKPSCVTVFTALSEVSGLLVSITVIDPCSGLATASRSLFSSGVVLNSANWSGTLLFVPSPAERIKSLFETSFSTALLEFFSPSRYGSESPDP